jgi:thiol-disulfide isomerase/thioredoxin
VSGHPGRGGRPPAGRPGRPGRSPHALALRRRRARRLWWAGAGAAAAVVAAVVVVIAVTAGGRTTAAGGTSAAGGAVPAAGSAAPGGSFTAVSGRTGTIASLRGHKSLLWFVATWCPSCQAGTQAMAGQAARLRAAGIEVVEVEDYADLGQPGPPMAGFARQFAGAAYHDPGWTFGTASRALTRAYNPQGYLDVYFLLGSSGRVAYVNSAPASTMSQLLAHAGGLT